MQDYARCIRHTLHNLYPKTASQISNWTSKRVDILKYGTPYLPYDIYFHYLRWFFIICGGYIIIRGDLFIIFGT